MADSVRPSLEVVLMRRHLRLWRLAVCGVLVAVLSHSGFLVGAETGSQPAAPFELRVRDNHLTLVAEQASVIIENARLYHHIRRTAQDLARLNKVKDE